MSGASSASWRGGAHDERREQFLGVIAVVFSITIIYRIAPGAAIVEALVLLVLITVAARHSGRL